MLSIGRIGDLRMVELGIEQQYSNIQKDLKGKDPRLATLKGLRDVAVDIVDIQNSVKSFIDDQFDKISKIYDEFWEKNPQAETNPYEHLLNVFVELSSYADDNDFEDIDSKLRKELEK